MTAVPACRRSMRSGPAPLSVEDVWRLLKAGRPAPTSRIGRLWRWRCGISVAALLIANIDERADEMCRVFCAREQDLKAALDAVAAEVEREDEDGRAAASLVTDMARTVVGRWLHEIGHAGFPASRVRRLIEDVRERGRECSAKTCKT